MPNAIFTFKEYLEDFASPKTKSKGLALIDKLVGNVGKNTLKKKISNNLHLIKEGERDLYF